MANFQSYLYDHVDFITESCTWTKPSNINEEKPILVHVYGSGGTGGDKYNFGAITNNGGGGGGLAVKLIDVSSLGATETITIGAVDDDPRNQSATTNLAVIVQHPAAMAVAVKRLIRALTAEPAVVLMEQVTTALAGKVLVVM